MKKRGVLISLIALACLVLVSQVVLASGYTRAIQISDELVSDGESKQFPEITEYQLAVGAWNVPFSTEYVYPAYMNSANNRLQQADSISMSNLMYTMQNSRAQYITLLQYQKRYGNIHIMQLPKTKHPDYVLRTAVERPRTVLPKSSALSDNTKYWNYVFSTPRSYRERYGIPAYTVANVRELPIGSNPHLSQEGIFTFSTEPESAIVLIGPQHANIR